MLVVLLLPTLVVANASSWAVRTVLDDRAFATTVGRVMDTPALESRVADAVTDVVVEEFAELPSQVRTAALTALDIDPGAETAEIRDWLDERVVEALRSEPVEEARDEIVLELHESMVDAVDGRGAVRVEGDRLILDVGDVYDAALDRIDPRAVQFVRVPEGRAEVVVAQAAELAAVQQGLSTLRAVQLVIPIAVVTAIGLIVLLAHRRVRALGIVGVAIMIAGAVSLAVAWFGGGVVGGIPDDPTAGRLAHDVYDQFVSLLVGQSALLIAGGAVIALLAWIILRRRASRSYGASPT
jgi:hypothetical protein